MKTKSKSDIKIGIATTATLAIVIAVLAAFSTPVSAQGDPGAGCNSTTKYYGNIIGDVYLEQQGWMENSPMTKTFDVPNGIIRVARVYTGVWGGSPGKGGFFNITIENTTGSNYTTDTYRACDPCPNWGNCLVDGYQDERCDALNQSINNDTNWNLDTVNMHDYITGCNVQFISFNATPYISNGTNTITVETESCADCYRGGWDGRIYLIALLVVYEDSSMPNMTYWINEGPPYLERGSDCDGPEDHISASKYFNGTNVSSPSRVKLWTLGWPHVINATEPPAYTKLNDHNLSYPDETESNGGYEVLLRWNNISTSYLSPPSNFLEYYDPDASYERGNVEVLIVQGPSNLPDLRVTDIEFPTMMRPNKNYTINATIKNEGGADVNASTAFNVTLYANNKNWTENVTGLNASKSKTVNFKDVNLSEECYTFKVVADSDGNVNESNENNNATSEKYQVGYVVVVKSDSDFEKLNESGDYALPTDCFKNESGTYYIQNLTTENCAGRGIWIENTDKKFVINNCTVHSCKYSGVYLHNLSNGTINGSRVKDNSLKGIKVVNSRYVDITNNLVQNNSEYGIDVYPEDMPEVDCEYINITNNNTVKENLYGIELIGSNCTVKDNNITNNSVYGIYMFGNDSEVYNNTIKYNDDYGIYLDNTTAHPCCENGIYENKFIDNKVGSPGHQGYDSGTTNYWNTTDAGKNYTGNYWKDWQNNNGFPGSYEIDGNSNKDKRPKGLYDFLTGAGTDKWAFRYRITQDEFNSPIYPSTEFTTDPDQYGNIEANDDTFQIDDTGKNQDGYYAAHRFNFSIAEPESKVTKINVTWNGKGYHDLTDYNGAYLYIWNFTSVAYYQLAITTSGDEQTLTGEKTGTCCSDYIDSSGNVTVLVKQKSECSFPPSKKSYIETDYVRVAVVATP